MVFEEAGTYTIEYTATDDCGNTATAERTVIVEVAASYLQNENGIDLATENGIEIEES